MLVRRRQRRSNKTVASGRRRGPRRASLSQRLGLAGGGQGFKARHRTLAGAQRQASAALDQGWPSASSACSSGWAPSSGGASVTASQPGGRPAHSPGGWPGPRPCPSGRRAAGRPPPAGGDGSSGRRRRKTVAISASRGASPGQASASWRASANSTGRRDRSTVAMGPRSAGGRCPPNASEAISAHFVQAQQALRAVAGQPGRRGLSRRKACRPRPAASRCRMRARRSGPGPAPAGRVRPAGGRAMPAAAACARRAARLVPAGDGDGGVVGPAQQQQAPRSSRAWAALARSPCRSRACRVDSSVSSGQSRSRIASATSASANSQRARASSCSGRNVRAARRSRARARSRSPSWARAIAQRQRRRVAAQRDMVQRAQRIARGERAGGGGQGRVHGISRRGGLSPGTGSRRVIHTEAVSDACHDRCRWRRPGAWPRRRIPQARMSSHSTLRLLYSGNPWASPKRCASSACSASSGGTDG